MVASALPADEIIINRLQDYENDIIFWIMTISLGRSQEQL